MDSDFSQLYAQLGLSPQAGAEDLKRAYRRRIGQLHPDRHAGDTDAPDTQAEFAHLVSLYGMAMRFQRQHGRLPGEASATEAPAPALDPAARLESTVEPTPAAAAHVAQAEPLDRRGWLLLGALALLIVLAYFNTSDPRASIASTSTDSPLSSRGGAAVPDPVPAQPEELALGMDMALVLNIQGRPSYREGDVWSYGPSWLRFEQGHLVEWYSSPLYPLKVSTPTGSRT